MRLRFIMDVSVKQLLNNIKSTLVVVLSLTVCVASVFLMTEALLFSNSFLTEMEVNRRTYSINGGGISEDCGASYMLYKEVMYNENFPEISCINGIHTNPSVNINVEHYVAADIYLEEDVRYMAAMDIIEGRTFLEQELVDGANVVIISNDLSSSTEGVALQVGDEILINNISYEIIGIDKYNSYLTEANVLKNENFYIYFDSIMFAERLSAEEEQTVRDLFAAVGAKPVSLYDQYFSGFVMHVITYIILIGLVLYCAFSIIAQLFHYMVKSREYEYNIYKVLGIRSLQLLALYYTPILLVYTLSGILGFGIYRGTEVWQKYIEMADVLSVKVCIVCYLLIGCVLLLVTMPHYMILKRKSAIETR